MISYDLIEHGKPLQRVVRDTPKPRGTEVLIRVTHCGVCHTDLHIWDGYFDLGSGKRFYVEERGCVPPFTLGHEPYGVVEALGPQAAGVAIGAKGVVFPWIGCGVCAVCEAGRENYCLSQRFIGVFKPGAYASHIIVPHPKYIVDAEGIEPSFAATLACSGVTTYSAIRKLPPLSARDWVIVCGCGGLGMMALSLLRTFGIERVIACDIDDRKLAVARQLGTRDTVNARDADAALASIQTISNNAVAGVLDFVGSPATANLGIAALAKGGRYVLCGLFGGEITLSVPPIAQRGISIFGSYVGTLQELREVVALARNRKLKPTPVDTRPLAEVNRTLEALRAGNVLGRVVLEVDESQ